jgi:hypothetical protein
MGEITPWRRRRLAGFIPDDIEEQAAAKRDLVKFAKTGEPAIIARPENFNPDDCP